MSSKNNINRIAQTQRQLNKAKEKLTPQRSKLIYAHTKAFRKERAELEDEFRNQRLDLEMNIVRQTKSFIGKKKTQENNINAKLERHIQLEDKFRKQRLDLEKNIVRQTKSFIEKKKKQENNINAKLNENQTIANLSKELAKMRVNSQKRRTTKSTKTLANVPNNVLNKVIQKLPQLQKTRVGMTSKNFRQLVKNQRQKRIAEYHVIDVDNDNGVGNIPRSDEEIRKYKFPVEWIWYLQHTKKQVNPGDIVWIKDWSLGNAEYGPYLFMVQKNKSLAVFPKSTYVWRWYRGPLKPFEHIKPNLKNIVKNIDYTKVLQAFNKEVTNNIENYPKFNTQSLLYEVGQSNIKPEFINGKRLDVWENERAIRNLYFQ